MKSTLSIVLLALALVRTVCASGPPDIFISTAEAGISYRLVDHNRRSEKETKSLEETVAWIAGRVSEGEGAVIMIYPDDRTSFRTVLDLLRRFKTAGVKHFAVGVAESSGHGQVLHYLDGKADMIHSLDGITAPSTK